MNYKPKHNTKMILFILYCLGPLIIMYTIYKYMTSLWVHLYNLFILYLIYINSIYHHRSLLTASFPDSMTNSIITPQIKNIKSDLNDLKNYQQFRN